MSASKPRLVVAAVLFAAAIFQACSLGPNQCLRMSDCESPYMCVEGTCIANQSLSTTDDSEGGVTEAGGATDQ